MELARENGWTISETAQTYGLNRGTVSRWYAEEGLDPGARPGEQPPHVRKRERAKVLRLRKDGLSLRAIAEKSVYSYSQVRIIVAGDA